MSSGSPPSSGSTRRSSARPPSKRRPKISWKCCVDLREGFAEALLGSAGHAAQGLLEILDRGDQVVVLGAQKGQPLVQLAVLLVSHQIDRPEGLQLFAERGAALAHCLEVRGRAVTVRAGRRSSTPYVRRASCASSSAPHASLRRAQLQLVDSRREGCHLAVHTPDLRLHIGQLPEELFVVLGADPHLPLQAIALAGGLLGGLVRALALALDRARRARRVATWR